MKFYHATTPKAAESILQDGVIRCGWDGYIYLCKKPEDACLFLAVRGEEHFKVFEVELPETDVKESADHCEAFFGCKAYIYGKDIPTEMVTDLNTYTIQ